MTKTYIIADLHGRHDLLIKAIERIEQSSHSGGTIVFTGDYVDRGPASRQVIETLMAGPQTSGWKWVCLKGNHEDMMVGTVDKEYEAGWWVGNGGGNTILSYGGEPLAEHIEWARNLPLVYADGKRVFVHAGVDETIPLDEQTEKVLVWSRVPKHRDYSHPEGYVVHGHTPFDDGPVILAGRANFDTGAFFTGRLVVGVFDDNQSGGPVATIEIKEAA
jgi:serine/threonine protein phosphatase 1